jgi:GT2 family glycosyltransferase
MQLSVIIVNYNVRYFLEQCLKSVSKAIQNIEAEVFVVDNNSSDASMQMVKEKFPFVKRIENKENVGFSKANNQAILQSKGKYILLLNPDTIVEEDTFEKCLAFMDKTPDAGGLGVKMIDGKGRFLPESKRGLPTPAAAFYKIFGFSTLFPNSKKFSKYHLGYLPEDEINEIEILSGAYMLLRKSVLDKIGLLDETFFMYGEDIDLSYRIIKEGYKNYYFPDTKIIHYKGESTKKSSVNYVFVFYNAMIIFANKHFSQKMARSFSFFIKFGIYLRAFIAILMRFLQSVVTPLADVLFLLLGSYNIVLLVQKYKHINFPGEAVWLNMIFAICSLIIINVLFKTYKPKQTVVKILQTGILSAILYVIIYAFLPENLRFSRLATGFVALYIPVAFLLSRIFLHLLKFNSLSVFEQKKSILITHNNLPEYMLENIKMRKNIIKQDILFSENSIKHKTLKYPYVGKFYQLFDLIQIYNYNEVIFSTEHLSFKNIIETIAGLRTKKLIIKTLLPESNCLIGSNTIEQIKDKK